MIPASLACGALLLGGTRPPPLAGDPVRILAGEKVVSSLSAGDPSLPGRGPVRWFAFEAGSAGPVTVALDSYDFDAFLRVESEGGETVAENEDGWLFTNAQVVFTGAPSTRYRIAAAAAHAGACGEFELRLFEGESPWPAGDAFLAAAIAYQSRAAERALARGDGTKAGWHRLLEGSRRMERQQFSESRVALGAALDLAREGRDPELEERVHLAFGLLHSRLADYPAAVESLERQISLAREIGQSEDEGAGRLALAAVRTRTGDYAVAIEEHERALALYRSIPPLSSMGSVPLHKRTDRRWAQMGAHASLCELRFALRDHARALEHGRESLRFAREIPSRAGQARALAAIGEVEFALGDFAQAREDLESALRLARELSLPAREVQALGRLGDLHLALGEYPEAKACFQRRLAVSRELGDPSGEWAAISSLGSVLSVLGDPAGARALHEQALRLARDRGERPALARELGNLGRASLLLGDLPNAAESFEEERHLAEELGDDSRRAEAALGLGQVHAARREFAVAAGRFEEAALLARRIGERPGEAQALANRGAVLVERGDLAEARRLAEESLALLGEVAGGEILLHALLVRGRAALGQRDSAGALEALERAARSLEAPALRGLETSEASGLRSRWSSWGELAQDLTALRLEEAGSDAALRTRIAAEGFREAARWKGRALLEGIAEYRSGGRTPDAVRIRRERNEALGRRDRILERTLEAIRAGRAPGEVEAMRKEADAFLAQAVDLGKKLEAISPADAALDLPGRVDAESLAALLDPGSLLVEYVEGERRLYAYVVGREGASFHDLGDRAAIEAQARIHVERLSRPHPLATVEEVRESGQALFAALLAPLLERAGGSRLVLVPTGPLAALPFEALVVGAGRGGPSPSFADLEFVLDRWELDYSPSSGFVAALATAPPRPGGGRVLLLADPIYPAEGDETEPPVAMEAVASSARGAARTVPEAAGLVRVERSREEVLALARLLLSPEEGDLLGVVEDLRTQRSGSLTGRRFELHLGGRASRARLSGDLRPYSILHLAAHGFIDRQSPQRSGIALSFRGGEDGYLAIADVLELVLDADLAVLSACETGRGEWRAGEGVQSLASAFLYAGARAVVASLWQVDDAVAAATMETFYRGFLVGGRTRSQALRESKLAVRRSAESRGRARGFGSTGGGSQPPCPEAVGHPFFWAPFILVGRSR